MNPHPLICTCGSLNFDYELVMFPLHLEGEVLTACGRPRLLAALQLGPRKKNGSTAASTPTANRQSFHFKTWTEVALSPEQLAGIRKLRDMLSGMVRIKKYNKFIQFKPYPKPSGLLRHADAFRQVARICSTPATGWARPRRAHLRPPAMDRGLPRRWGGCGALTTRSVPGRRLGAKETRDIIQEKLCGDPEDAAAFGPPWSRWTSSNSSPRLARARWGIPAASGRSPPLLAFSTPRSPREGSYEIQGTSKDWIWRSPPPTTTRSTIPAA